jgi:hypothetical protein
MPLSGNGLARLSLKGFMPPRIHIGKKQPTLVSGDNSLLYLFRVSFALVNRCHLEALFGWPVFPLIWRRSAQASANGFRQPSSRGTEKEGPGMSHSSFSAYGESWALDATGAIITSSADRSFRLSNY